MVGTSVIGTGQSGRSALAPRINKRQTNPFESSASANAPSKSTVASILLPIDYSVPSTSMNVGPKMQIPR